MKYTQINHPRESLDFAGRCTILKCMSKNHIHRLCRRLLLPVLLLGTGLLAADTFIYTPLTVHTNQARGTKHRHLLRFSLTFVSNTRASVNLTTLGFQLGQYPDPFRTPLVNGSLYLLSEDENTETLLAAAPPLTHNFLALLFTTPLAFTNNQTSKFLLKGDFFLNPAAVNVWTNTLFVMGGSQSGSANFIGTSPAIGISLSNADTAGAGFTNTHRVWDNVADFSNAVPGGYVYPQFYRDEEYTLLGIAVRNKYYTQSSNAFALNALPFQSLQTDIFESVSVYENDGDVPDSWDSGDTLVGSITPEAGKVEFAIPFTRPVLVGAQPRLLWVRAALSPWRNPVNVESWIRLQSENTNFFVNNTRIAVTMPAPLVYSATNTLTDTTGPGPVSSVSILAGEKNLLVRWTNPVDRDLTRAIITYNSGSYPPDPWTGNQHILDGMGTALGRATNTMVSNGLMPGPTYHMCLFLLDDLNNYTCAYSNTFVCSADTNGSPPVPTGITVTPTRETFEISWDRVNVPDLYGYRFKFSIRQPDYTWQYVDYPGLCFTNRIVIRKNEIGITALDQEQELYLSVVSMDINGYKSSNDFFDQWSGQTLGLLVRYRPLQYTGGNAQVYRNVFRPDLGEYARILVNVGERTTLSVKVYSISGELMATLANRTVDPGEHEFRWFGSDGGGIVNPGVYIAHVRTDRINRTFKMIVRR